MKLITISFLIMILCQGCVPRVSEEYATAYSLMGNFARKQQVENGLSVCGVGHSMPDGKIKKLTLYFMAQRKLMVDDARILYIMVTQEMLNQVNDDAELRCFLDHYPFTVDDLNISISFEEESGRDVDPPYIAFVSTTKGIIHYAWYDASTDLYFNERLKEPYDEALHIVRSDRKVSNSGLNLSYNQ